MDIEAELKGMIEKLIRNYGLVCWDQNADIEEEDLALSDAMKAVDVLVAYRMERITAKK